MVDPQRVDIWVFPRYSFELSDGAVLDGPSGLVAALDLAEGETMASVGSYLITGSPSRRLGGFDVYISEQHWTDMRLGYKFERKYLETAQESVAFQPVFEVHSGKRVFCVMSRGALLPRLTSYAGVRSAWVISSLARKARSTILCVGATIVQARAIGTMSCLA